MARIRTVKPELWTSEQFVECSPNARLLFIGLFNFVDDSGIHPLKPMRIKMQIFPADGFDKAAMDAMLWELADAGLIDVYEVEGAEYLIITGFAKHQRIDQPTYKHPLPSGEVPQNIRRAFSEHSANVHPRKGKEGKGRDNNTGAAARKKQSRAVALPEEFTPTESHEALVSKLNDKPEVNITLITEFEKFCDHHKAKGSTFKDWNAALNNWLRNAAKFQAERNPTPPSGGAPRLKEFRP